MKREGIGSPGTQKGDAATADWNGFKYAITCVLPYYHSGGWGANQRPSFPFEFVSWPMYNCLLLRTHFETLSDIL